MTPLVTAATQRTAVITAVAMCLVMSAFLAWEGWLSSKIAHDFAVYWRTANQPVEMAYRIAVPPFPYAPTMLLWIAPLAFVGKWPAYFLLGGCSLAAFVLACRPYLTRWALALALISPPMFRCLRNGQVSALLASLLIWSCGTANRVAAGAALGVIASIKPQLVLMAPLMLALNRDWRAFLSAGAAFALIVLLSVVAFGPEPWREWLASMSQFHAIVTGTNVIEIGITPAAVAEKFGLAPVPFMLLGAVAGAWIIHHCRDREPLEKAAAIGAASLMAAPYALAYDLVVIVPFLAAQAMRGRLLGAFGIVGMLPPLPLIAAAVELVRPSLRLPAREVSLRRL